jgi:GT2 family glycosyltransferase
MSSKKQRIAAVILNWNGAELTQRCIANLRRSSLLPDRIIVVDNGSEDSDFQRCRRLVQGTDTLIRLPLNCGFAGGMNAGISSAVEMGADYIWLLNNDAFPDQQCLDLLSNRMDQDPSIAATTPKLVSQDGIEQFCWAVLNWKILESATFRSDKQISNCCNTWISGAAMLVRTDALRHVGIFDTRFFAYVEDVDWCLRCHKRGWRLQVVPDATCTHLVSSSTGGDCSPTALYLMARNHWLLYRKTAFEGNSLATLARYFSSTLCAVYGDAHGHDIRKARARLLGLLAGLRREIGPPGLLKSKSTVPALIASILARCPWRLLNCMRSALGYWDPNSSWKAV